DRFGDSTATADSFSHFAEHGPIQFEPSPVPPSFRLDEKKRLLPLKPEPAHQYPKQLIEWPSLGLGLLCFKTASCCRRMRFSSIRLRRSRRMRSAAPNQNR